MFVSLYYILNSIAEPDLDISISDEDKEECLKQVQILCDHINEVERRLEPQPLPTIPLPTPLEDFSWVALGRTLINLHNYITDNHMVCFNLKIIIISAYMIFAEPF